MNVRQINDLNGKAAIEYKEFKFKLQGKEFTLSAESSHKLNNLEGFLLVNYYSEACGTEGGLSYLSWNGSKFAEFAHCTHWGDAGVGSMREWIIFPDEENGINGKIKFHSETQSTEDEMTNWIKTTLDTREHSWDGEKLVPPLNIEN